MKKYLLQNTLLAQALGDAFGYLVEFDSWEKIQIKYGEEGIKYNPENLNLTVSDDTQMTLFCLNALIDAKNNANILNEEMEDPTKIIYLHYLDWFKTQGFSFNEINKDKSTNKLLTYPILFSRRAPGLTCLKSLSNAKMGTLKNRVNDSKGCGGIMRVMPVGFYASNVHEAFNWGAKQAAITHGHPDGFYSAGVYSAIVFELINENFDMLKILNIIEGILKNYIDTESILDCISKIKWVIREKPGLGNVALNEELGQGWVGDESLAIAVYCAVTSISFKEVIEKSTNHSGDSDSTAMLACGLWYLLNRNDSFKKDINYLDIKDCLIDMFPKINIED